MSVINLSKGQRIDLTKGSSLKKARVGLGWETNQYHGTADFDLDASAFLVSNGGKVTPHTNFVFYNNEASHDGSVVHSGDNLTGGTADSIEEELTVDFEKIADNIEKIAFTVTIHDYEQRRQNFGQVSNAFVALFDDATGNELLRYKLDEDFSIQTSVIFCEIYREGNDWKFKAVGEGFNGGLGDMCKHYGLPV